VRLIRQLSTRRLILLISGLFAIVAGTAAIALAATAGGPTPPARALNAAIQDALAAPPVQGVTARIRFTNHLIDAAGVSGSNPILSGADGRVWASPDGRLRIELQSDGGAGDAEVAINGRNVTVYDPGSRTVFKSTLPARKDAAAHSQAAHSAPTLARIDRMLREISRHATLSGAVPGDVAGKAAYTVRVSPKRPAGLLGGAELAWNAANGVPLRAAVYAAGSGDPVLQVEATKISYRPVSASDLTVTPPPGTKVVDLTPGSGHRREASPRRHVAGVARVRRAVAFPLAAPAKLADRARTGTRLIRSDRSRAALVTYGRGLNGIAVIESRAKPASRSRSGGDLKLPTVSINGNTGQELETALGTVVRFQRGGVDYMVLGSVPRAVAEAAARGL
jgi:outer membrane lipoprotein-sorting protein